jgi:hypothetical protein
MIRRLIQSLVLVAAISAFPDASQAFGGEIKIKLEAGEGPLDNPFKGWCPYVDAGEIRQPYSMVFLYAPWSRLEPNEGEYAFEAWENRDWSVREAKDKHIVFRVYIDYPGLPSGLPDWLRKKGIKETRYRDHGGGFSPDYNDARMIEAIERLIKALGKRYDADPRVAFIELGLLGFWGEWHTWPRDELYASNETERRVIEAYRAAFPHKILLARYARDDAGSRDFLGFHDDMFPEDTNNGEDWSFYEGLKRSGRLDNWKKASIGGEMVPNRAKVWMKPKFAQTLAALELCRFSWIGPYCPPLEKSNDPEFLDNCRKLVRRMGYQFQLKSIKHNQKLLHNDSLELAIEAENEGVAPFPYPWKIEVALIGDDGTIAERERVDTDVRNWLPGTFRIEARFVPRVPPGRYRIAVGMIDPATNRAAIKFANRLERTSGWTVLSRVSIDR